VKGDKKECMCSEKRSKRLNGKSIIHNPHTKIRFAATKKKQSYIESLLWVDDNGLVKIIKYCSKRKIKINNKFH
jgi:hypothetical protein